MESAEFSHSEAMRFVALDYGMFDAVDAATVKTFDSMARLAAVLCQSSIAAISLVEAACQRVVVSYGLSGSLEVPGNTTFCAHTILSDGLMEVADTLRDARFAQHPLVLEGPKIRFYAGMPLVLADGLVIGTLCVMDCDPKQLSPEQRQSLEELAATVVALLEAKRSLSQSSCVARLVDQSPCEIFAFNARTLRFSYVNETARNNLRYSVDELAELTPRHMAPTLSNHEFTELLKPLRSGKVNQVVFETKHLRKDGSVYPVEIRLQLNHSAGRPEFIAVAGDISDRVKAQKAVQESEQRARGASSNPRCHPNR